MVRFVREEGDFVCSDVFCCRNMISEEIGRVVNHEPALESTKGLFDEGVVAGFLKPRLTDDLITGTEDHEVWIMGKHFLHLNARAARQEGDQDVGILQNIDVDELAGVIV